MSDSKAVIRRRVRTLRDAAPAAQRAEWSRQICERALALPAYRAARTIHIYLSFQSEVDTQPIIEHALAHDKRVLVPVFVKDSEETPCAQITSLDPAQFYVGWRGLRIPKVTSPVALDEIALVFVPVVAFAARESSVSGWSAADEVQRCARFVRIGYGAGYYDRFLGRMAPDVPRIGLAFSLQRVEAIPVEWFDAPLDDVLTEREDNRRHG